jgi:hypothetical protein
MTTLATPDDNQPTLFERIAACPATREAVARYRCPLCGRSADEHDSETSDVLRDDRGDFRAWLLSLPRVPR